MSAPRGHITLTGGRRPLGASALARGVNIHVIRSAAALLAMAFAVQLVAGTAVAKVLEIGESGQVVVHDQPEVYLTPDARGRAIGAATRSVPAYRPAARRTTVAPLQVRADIETEAMRHGLSPALVEAVAWQESRFNQTAVSRKGAVGVMQLMPGTSRVLGVDPNDSSANIRGGTTYLASLLQRYNGDVIKALAAYNSGPGAVDRHGGPPPFKETQAYVAAILDHMAGNVTQVPERFGADASGRNTR